MSGRVNCSSGPELHGDATGISMREEFASMNRGIASCLRKRHWRSASPSSSKRSVTFNDK
jgi:hypothetical protein